MKKTTIWLIPLTIALGLTACSAGQKSSSTAYDQAEVTAETTAAAYAAPQEAAEDYVSGGTGETAELASSTATNTTVYPQGRKLIRNVELYVETDTFDELLAGLQKKITELEGYIEQSDISGNSLNYRGEPTPKRAVITARIPNTNMDSFINTVQTKGNVTNKTENTQDVTLQYSDITSRKKSLGIEQERIWEFLEKAETIDSVVALEQRLSEIRYELESMESQLRLYDNQVDYSTVYLNISEVKDFTPVEPETPGTRIKKGFADNMLALSTALTTLMIGIITSSPFWIPLLLIALLVIAIVKKSGKKKEKKLKETEPKEQNSDEQK